MRVRIMKEYKDLERSGVIDPVGTEFDTTEARAELLFKLGFVGKVLDAKVETATPEKKEVQKKSGTHVKKRPLQE